MRELSSRSAKRSPAASLHPADLRAGPVGRGVGGRLRAAGAVAQVDVDADDVGLAGGEGQHPLAAAADDERGTGPLHGAGREGVAQHLVVLAVEVERPVGAQQSLHDLDRLLEARHADGRVVVGQPGLVVVGAHPAGTEAHFEAAVAEHVERGRLLGQHEGVAVVVAEDQRPHAQRGGGRGHRGQGGHGGELVAEVVGHEQRAVAEVLGLAGLLGPGAGGAVGRLAQLRGEAKPAVVCHAAMLPHIGAACVVATRTRPDHGTVGRAGTRRKAYDPPSRCGHTSTPSGVGPGRGRRVKSAVAQAAPGAVGTTATVWVCHCRNWARTSAAGKSTDEAPALALGQRALQRGRIAVEGVGAVGPGMTANPPGCGTACWPWPATAWTSRSTGWPTGRRGRPTQQGGTARRR